MKPIKKKSPSSRSINSAKTSAPTGAADPGEAAYQQLRGRLDAIAAERVVQPRTDVRAAATFVINEVAGRLKDTALLARFANLPAAEFDRSVVQDLVPAAQAALWAQAQQAVGEASEATPRLAVDLFEQCTALRERMLDLCVYHFKGDASLMLQVEDIRAGQGYLDLAEDLGRLAALYREHHQLLKQDLRFYVAGDATDAVALAQRITAELRLLPGRTLAAREVAWRTWALVQQLYDEVARGRRFLLHYQGGAAAFPALNSVGRGPSRRQRVKSVTEVVPTRDGAPGAA